MESLAKQTWRVERLRLALLVALALCLSACAAKPSPNAPAANEPPYPILMTDSSDRRDAALADWAKFTSAQGIRNAPAPELQPVTATIRSLPTLTSTPATWGDVNVNRSLPYEFTNQRCVADS